MQVEDPARKSPTAVCVGASLWFACALALLPGCFVLQAPERVVSNVVPTAKSKQADPIDLQLQVQRFADDYSSQTASAVDEYVRRLGTDAARQQGVQWKLGAVSAAVQIATGPQPKANLLDMVSLASLNRAAIEDLCQKSTNAAAFQPWLETSRNLESNAWELVAGKLSPEQITELREAITQWQARNPGARNLFAARPQEYASMVKNDQRKRDDPNSVFSLVGLDPMSGLDPAVRELTMTRLFAERAMFALQRMPFLLRWQTESLVDELARKPAVQEVLTNATRLGESAERLSLAAESVSRTAAQLPGQVAAEREAILTALDQQEGKLRDLAIEVNHALASADKMSGTLSITITNFDALMKRFGVGESSGKTAPASNSTPFSILDYATTAAQVGDMAKDLNTLILSVNQSVPQLERLSQQATADARGVVNHGFRLGLVLVVVLLGGAVGAALLYRLLVDKLRRQAGSRGDPSA